MIPEGWERTTIGDCVKFEGGTQPPRSTFIFSAQPGYVRLVQTRDFKTDKYITYIPITVNHKTFDVDDIMIGRYGPPVFQIYRGLSGAYNVALIKASPKSARLDREYMYYVLNQTKLFQLIDALSQRSSGQTGVDMEALKAFDLPLPDVAEQEKIVTVLATWDRAIETIEALIANARAQKQALMQQLLSGKHRLPGFSGEWHRKPINEIATRITRRNDGTDLPVLTISSTSGFVRQDEKYSRFMAGKSVDTYIVLNEGEFAYNKGNSKTYEFGCIFDLEGYARALVPHVYVCFKLKTGYSHRFYKALFQADYLAPQLGQLVNTGVRNNGLLNIKPSEFLGTKVPVPPLDEQDAIAAVMEAASRTVIEHEAQLTALRQEKAALMQQLLTGKRRVKLPESEVA